jgi:serine phosphatase RsbU (regulator of sigma subunit)
VSAMSVPLLTPMGNLGVLYVDSRTAGQNYKPRHVDLLSAIGSHVSQRLAAVLEGVQAVRQETSKGEVSVVRAVQARMEPSRAAQWSNFEVAVHCRPGSQRCSDVFDIMRLPNGKAAILLARVRGERLEAAISLPAIRAGFRAAMLHGDLPQAALKVLNLLVADRLDGGHTDALCAQIDPNSGEVLAASAGDIASVILAGDGSVRRLLTKTAAPLGVDRKAGYRAHKGGLEAGEILVLGTPGMETAVNPQGEHLDMRVVVDALRECFGQTLHQTLEELVAELGPYLPDGEPADDVTLALAARRG